MCTVMPRRASGRGGALLYRRPAGGDVEVLLAHPGEPVWAKRDAGAWTVPKGEFHDGEESWAVAQIDNQPS